MAACTDYQVFQVLQQIEATTKRTEKLRLLQTLRSCEIAKELFELVLDKHIVFNVSKKTLEKIPCGKKHQVDWKTFKLLLQKITATTKRSQIEALLRAFFLKTDPLSCKWYKRILLKNLQAGVSKKLVQEVWPDISIAQANLHNIKPMLGYELWSLEKSSKLEKIFSACTKWFIEPKYDGIRVLAVVLPNEIVCLSRNGKELPNVTLLLEHDLLVLRDALKTIYPKGFVLDGEIYGKDWHATMSRVFRSKNVKPEQILADKVTKYYVWDILDAEKFINRIPVNETYEQRKLKLKQILDKLKGKLTRIKLVPHKVLDVTKLVKQPDDLKHLISFLYQAANEAIDKGFEGIMLKCATAPYVYDRSEYWIKVKKIHTVDVKVIGVDKNGNQPGEIAALIVDYKGKEVRVGSGLTKAQRQCFYNHPEDIIGEYIEIAYQEETPDGSLRFPRLLRIRLDKSPYKRKKYHCLLNVM